MIRIARITWDASNRQVWLEGTPLDLTTMEYDIMARLVQSAGSVVARERLVAEVFERDLQPDNRALDMHISNLRRKLGHHGSLLITVRGIGHMLRASEASDPR